MRLVFFLVSASHLILIGVFPSVLTSLQRAAAVLLLLVNQRMVNVLLCRWMTICGVNLNDYSRTAFIAQIACFILIAVPGMDRRMLDTSYQARNVGKQGAFAAESVCTKQPECAARLR